MRSMVERLIPKESSPINASPLNFSSTRLYFAVAAILVSLCDPFLRNACCDLHAGTVSLLVDPFADHVQHKTRDGRAARFQKSFHGLLARRILHEDLAE